MKKDMNKWLASLPESGKALPILSFPCISLLGCSVKELISDSEKQAEGMALVAKRVDSAASVSLMDLSVEAECFGASVRFSDDEVPTVVGRLINDSDEAEALKVPTVGSARSGIYIDAIRKAAEKITDRPVLAGIIGPFSLAARLFDVSEIMIECYDDPDSVHVVLEKCTEFLINYAKAYKDAGADGVMMAEPVSGLLSPALEEEFSSPYVKRIADAVMDDGFAFIYHNCGNNTPRMLDSILSIGASAYHFGNSVSMKEMLDKIPSDVLVMGNIDPAGVLRLATPQAVKETTKALMDECSEHKNFVISSGCDMPPLTPWENIDAFFEAVSDHNEK